MEVSVQFHAPDALPPGRQPQYAMVRRRVRPRDGRDAMETREILPLQGIELRPSGQYPVNIPRELSRYNNCDNISAET
jgi:hypothetical protein